MPRKPAAQKNEGTPKVDTATSIVGTTEGGQDTGNTVTTAVVDIQTPQAADTSSSPTSHKCEYEGGCENEAPKGPLCSGHYEQDRQERGQDRCSDCGKWTPAYFVDGVRSEFTRCYPCRQARRQQRDEGSKAPATTQRATAKTPTAEEAPRRLTPAEKLAQNRQEALEQMKKADDSMADALEKYPNINLARAEKMYTTGVGEGVAEKYADAVVSFQLVEQFVGEAAKPFRELEEEAEARRVRDIRVMHKQIDEVIPALIKEIEDLVDAARSHALFSHSRLEVDLADAKKLGNPTTLAEIAEKEGAPGFVRTRVQRLQEIKEGVNRKVGNFSVFRVPEERRDDEKTTRPQQTRAGQRARQRQDAIIASMSGAAHDEDDDS